MKNDFIEYYGEYCISPVRQDIENIERHYERRRKLYRQCGIPTIAFRNARILEVGPGGGYNTLAFFHWGSGYIDLVEANPKGIEDMRKLFAEQHISKNRYNIIPCKIEDYCTDEKYDIIIAEGFIQYLNNQREVIRKLQELVAENGIIVITCSDDVCLFIEIIKRLVGVTVTKDITEYNEKVEYLDKLFAPQLAHLRGVSRNCKDWVQDQIFNPALVNEMELSMLGAIEHFKGFDILGSSPQMFTDYSWYKDIEYVYQKDYQEQFQRKRLSLLMAGMSEKIMQVEQVEVLVKSFEAVKNLESEYEKTYNMEKIQSIIKEMNSVEELVRQNFDDRFVDVFCEIEKLLLDIQNESINMERYPHFFSAFGRTQQYMSFVKK